MADEFAHHDVNHVTTLLAVTAGNEIREVLVDDAGQLLVVGGTGGATDVTIHDPTVTSQKLAIDAMGRIGLSNFPASYPVTGTVTVSNPTTNPETGLAKDIHLTPVTNRFSPSAGNAVEVTASGDTAIYTPTPGKAIRLKWLGLSSHPTGTAAVKVQAKFGTGGTPFYIWWMGAPGAFAHGVVRESAVNDVLYVNCDVAPGASKPLLVDIDVEEF